MNDPFFPNDPAGVFFEIRLHGFDATWAGANPLADGFCFGSETGQIIFTNQAGQPTSEPRLGSASGEAVKHWEQFLRLGPRDSPYRADAKAFLAKAGKPWIGD